MSSKLVPRLTKISNQVVLREQAVQDERMPPRVAAKAAREESHPACTEVQGSGPGVVWPER